MSEYDVAIIGAGAAGLTAAIYACRAGKTVIVFEKLVAGGQIVNTPKIANYPALPWVSGAEFSQALEAQAGELGAEIVYDEVEKVTKNPAGFSLKTSSEDFVAKTLIVATGQEARKLGLDGEDKFVGRGISFCATCDGAFYKDKTVIVVGGGNTALNDAIYLSEIAQKVYLVHRRQSFRGEQALQKTLREKSNVELVLGYTPVGLIEQNQKLVGLRLVETEADGQPKPDGETKDVNGDGVFLAVGYIPKNDLIRELVDLDDSGYVIADENCRTKTPGLFVAGDCRTKELRQLVTATADGAVAARGAIEMLN